MVEDPLISEYINRIGQNLVRNSDAKVPFTFQVIEGDSPNAFALPGGYVFVYTALIKIADEEDELAAAMAHEIAHVAARHMTRQATKSQIVSLAGIPVGVILGGGLGGAVIRQGANVGIPAAFLHFTRKDESEADYLGVQYLYAAGYDPNGAISIFEKLESLETEAARARWRASFRRTRWMPRGSRRPSRRSDAFCRRRTSTWSTRRSTRAIRERLISPAGRGRRLPTMGVRNCACARIRRAGASHGAARPDRIDRCPYPEIVPTSNFGGMGLDKGLRNGRINFI